MTNLSPDKKKPETKFLNPDEDIDKQMRRILNNFDNETKETVELMDPNNPEHQKQIINLRAALEDAEKEIEKLQPIDETAPLRMKLKEIAGKLKEINKLQEEKDKLTLSLEQINKNLKSRAGDPLDPLYRRKKLITTQIEMVTKQIDSARQSM